MLKIPSNVKQDAAIGNKMIKNGYAGGTQTGWNRGLQLANDTHISIEDARVMRAWFARHLYTSRPGFLKWIEDGEPVKYIEGKKNDYRGAIAWLIWGGDFAYEWINSPQVQKALDKKGYGRIDLPSLE